MIATGENSTKIAVIVTDNRRSPLYLDRWKIMVINFSFGKEKNKKIKEVISMIFIPIHLLEISITRTERAFACEGATNWFFYFYVSNKLGKDRE